jgi:hypothetical protein
MLIYRKQDVSKLKRIMTYGKRRKGGARGKGQDQLVRDTSACVFISFHFPLTSHSGFFFFSRL